MIDETHWKISNQELYKLEQQCKETFETIITNFEKKFHTIIGELNRSHSSSLSVLKSNVSAKISGQFSEIEFSKKYKKDKNYSLNVLNTKLTVVGIVIGAAIPIIIFILEQLLQN